MTRVALLETRYAELMQSLAKAEGKVGRVPPSCQAANIGKAGRKSFCVDVDAVVKLHEKGLTQHEIAEKIGCSRPRVSQILLKAGCARNPSKRPPKVDKDTIRAMAHRGHSHRDIAETLDCSRSWVSQILRQS